MKFKSASETVQNFKNRSNTQNNVKPINTDKIIRKWLIKCITDD